MSQINLHLALVVVLALGSLPLQAAQLSPDCGESVKAGPSSETGYDCQLDLSGGYQLFWSVTETQLRLCGVAPTNGWVGLGFSPNGGMVGSSAVIGRGFSDGTEDIQTYFLGSKNLAGIQPSPEFIIEDEFVVADMDNGMTRIYFNRPLSDVDFDLDQSQSLIYAYSASNNDNLGYHGPFPARSPFNVLFGSVTRLNETAPMPPAVSSPPESELVCPDPGDLNSDDVVNFQDTVEIINRILNDP